MELGKLLKNVLHIFECCDTSEFKEKLLAAALNNDVDKFNAFCELVQDLSVDWLQKIFQYYEADRDEKKQDYTPKSLARLCSHLTETHGSTVYDICAGSGALIIQKWVANPDKLFICEELDENVIPFLLFNMAVRNMNGYVINRNVLTLEFKSIYKVDKGEKFATVTNVSEPHEIEADEVISNPPYNIKWDSPTPMLADARFTDIIPPSSNANFAFVLTAIKRLKQNGKCAFILPNGCLSSSTELNCRKWLVDNGLLEKVILLPDRMFESTTIPVCVIVFSHGNDKIQMCDCRNRCVQEVREQNGQFGGASHTKRTYKKTVNVLPDSVIEELCKDAGGLYSIVTKVAIKQNDYCLVPSRYTKCGTDIDTPKYRDLQEIANNLNHIMKMKNSCKLVINEALAKSLGLDIEAFKSSKASSIQNKNNMKALNLDFEAEDYIQFTKNKNEFCFKSNDKEILPPIFNQFFSVWKNQIALLNDMENTYLTEFRDTLLPQLMRGEINVSDIHL